MIDDRVVNEEDVISSRNSDKPTIRLVLYTVPGYLYIDHRLDKDIF